MYNLKDKIIYIVCTRSHKAIRQTMNILFQVQCEECGRSIAGLPRLYGVDSEARKLWSDPQRLQRVQPDDR